MAWVVALAAGATVFAAPTGGAAQPHSTAAAFVAPRVLARGADAETAAAFELLLGQEIDRTARGRAIVDSRPHGPPPCADSECAARLARHFKAETALLCTLVRLGREHVATLTCVAAAGDIVWTHRVTAHRVEDLNEIATRFAQAAVTGELPKSSRVRTRHGATENARSRERAARLAERERTGRGDAQAPHGRHPLRDGKGDRALAANDDDSAGSTDATEEIEPRRSLATQGPRFGTVHPIAGSFAGVEKMMTFAWVWRHQTPAFTVEMVPALGLTWGGDVDRDGGQVRDWTILDLFIAWAPYAYDVTPIVGAGIGLHGLRLERDTETGRHRDSTLGVSLSAGAGVVLFRTYDFQVALDARYHVMLDRFAKVDGKGAHAITFAFGLQRR
jgi:hypothetical protein